MSIELFIFNQMVTWIFHGWRLLLVGLHFPYYKLFSITLQSPKKLDWLAKLIILANLSWKRKCRRRSFFINYLKLATLLILGLFLFSNSAYANGKYTVQSGDVLSRISTSHNVGLEALLASNSSIANPDVIFPGQIITIPEVNGKTFTVTAYTAGYESTGKRPGDPAYGITASGAQVKEGQTIACPPSLPFGTKVHIPYFEDTFTCADRGSAITKGRLDVYMANLDEALQFGVKELQAQIID